VKQVTLSTYQFSELSDEAKEKARDWYRSIADDDMQFHAESTIDDFKEIAKLIGIDVSNVYYSGFCSQGDGACFVGEYSYKSDAVRSVKRYAPLDTKLHAIVREIHAAGKNLSVKLTHRGRYCHSNSIDFQVYSTLASGRVRPGQDTQVIEALQGLMNWLYRRLEQDYDFIQSAEYIDETISANEYNFTIEGKRSVVL